MVLQYIVVMLSIWSARGSNLSGGRRVGEAAELEETDKGIEFGWDHVIIIIGVLFCVLLACYVQRTATKNLRERIKSLEEEEDMPLDSPRPIRVFYPHAFIPEEESQDPVDQLEARPFHLATITEVSSRAEIDSNTRTRYVDKKLCEAVVPSGGETGGDTTLGETNGPTSGLSADSDSESLVERITVQSSKVSLLSPTEKTPSQRLKEMFETDRDEFVIIPTDL